MKIPCVRKRVESGGGGATPPPPIPVEPPSKTEIVWISTLPRLPSATAPGTTVFALVVVLQVPPIVVLTVFTFNVLLVEFGAADFSGSGAAIWKRGLPAN